jgi:hypothetical protein
MQIRNPQQVGIKRWTSPAQYWRSPEGRRRKELRRLDRVAQRPRDMTPRLVKWAKGPSPNAIPGDHSDAA